jgi:Sulfatase
MSCISKWGIPLAVVASAGLGWAVGSGRLSIHHPASAGVSPTQACTENDSCRKGVQGCGTHLVRVETQKKDDKAARKPNILIIWGDDVGMWNISAYHRGMMGGKTPNIDRIARDGTIFMDHYAQASCTAGRAAFITGQYPIRVGLSTVGLGATVARDAVNHEPEARSL